MVVEYTPEESVEFIKKYYEEYEHMENVTIKPDQLYQTRRVVEGEITILVPRKKHLNLLILIN